MASTKTKDLPASKKVKGGGHNLNDSLTIIRIVRAAKPSKKDLAASKIVKAGGKRLNDNFTLVRVA